MNGKEEINKVKIENEKKWDEEEKKVKNLKCIGIVGIEENVRKEVNEDIRKWKKEGINVRMVNGDKIKKER